MKKFLFSLIFFSSFLFGQENKKTSTIMFSFDYSFQFPEMDLKDRYGVNSSIGGSIISKTKKNYLYFLTSKWIFGNKINEENIFDFIDGNNGDIINIDGQIPIIRTFQRGAQFHFNFGKKINLNIKKSTSGVVPALGIGYVYHKIFIENILGETPQLNEDLKRGYDRLSGGFSLKQSLTFMYLSNNNMKNFNIGLELIECWAKDLRINNYTNNIVPKNRFDLFIGITLQWIVPLKKRTTNNFYYY